MSMETPINFDPLETFNCGCVVDNRLIDTCGCIYHYIILQLKRAIHYNDLETVLYILDNVDNISIATYILKFNCPFFKHCTAIHQVLKYDGVMLEVLLCHTNFDINFTKQNLPSILNSAILSMNEQAVKLLCQFGANTRGLDVDGSYIFSPMLEAVSASIFLK